MPSVVTASTSKTMQEVRGVPLVVDASTVDWENFAVKIISWSRPTAKFNMQKKNVTRR